MLRETKSRKFVTLNSECFYSRKQYSAGLDNFSRQASISWSDKGPRGFEASDPSWRSRIYGPRAATGGGAMLPRRLESIDKGRKHKSLRWLEGQRRVALQSAADRLLGSHDLFICLSLKLSARKVSRDSFCRGALAVRTANARFGYFDASTAEQCASVQRRTSPLVYERRSRWKSRGVNAWLVSNKSTRARLVVWKLLSPLCVRKFVFYCICLVSTFARERAMHESRVWKCVRECVHNARNSQLGRKPISRKMQQFLVFIFKCGGNQNQKY